MYLFNNREEELSEQKNRLPVTAIPIMHKKQTLFEALTGEERSYSIGSLLLILVLLLHLWGAFWLLQPMEPVTLAQPLMMEASLISAPGQQASTAPPAPPKAQEPVKPSIQPKKPTVEKRLKEKKPVKQKQAKPPKPEAVNNAKSPVPSPAESFADASKTNSEAAKSINTAKSASGAKDKAEPYSEANFNANYGTNPKPKYPTIARSRGWQGKVLLRVNVSAEGLSESVTIHRSSGHDMLDESAIAAVEKWKFIPAKRGDTAVACTVIVPIIFALNN